MINYVDYEMADGTVVKLAITMKGLSRLRSIDEDTFRFVNQLFIGGKEEIDIVDMAQLLYGAYICSTDSEVSLDEFYEAMNPDIGVTAATVIKLVNAQKKSRSAKPSKKPQKESTKAD